MKTKSAPALDLADLTSARRRIATGLRLTPCLMAPTLSEATAMRIWLKRDDLQRTGSFKERGARNALLSLDPSERARGVVAASAGNHALGLAYHGSQLGIRATVVVPRSAPAVKISRCQALGAAVLVHGDDFDSAQLEAAAFARQCRATLVHPFDDLRVIAGQGSMALEFLEQVPDLDTVVVPVGGGGMLAGIAIAVKAKRPRVRVIAVEPGNAAGFLAGMICGKPTRTALHDTVADGLAVAAVGENAFALAAPRVDDVVTVTESEIAAAIAALARDCGAVAEGAGAAALAAVLAGKVRGRNVVVPVSGRNIDPARHHQIVAAQPELPRPATISRAA